MIAFVIAIFLTTKHLTSWSQVRHHSAFANVKIGLNFLKHITRPESKLDEPATTIRAYYKVRV